jgi:mono/diheme cytochrome c family protein
MDLRRAMLLAVLLGSANATVGCTDDNDPGTPAPVADAGKEAAGDAEPPPADAADADHAGMVARGFYLVDHVAACGDCHTPRGPDGKLDMTKYLAGSQTPYADVVPDDGGVDGGLGKIYANNLTPDMETGLGKWSDDQIKKAFLDGIDDQGKPLIPIMPYYVFHNMTDDDANAIVAYLRSLSPVKNAIPESEPVPGFSTAAKPVPVDAIPVSSLAPTDANYKAAKRGQYLAGQIGVCMECHTKHVMAAGVPLDTTKLFAGDEVFHLPPPFGDVHSSNITPDPDGIKDLTPANVKDLLKKGTDEMGRPICPPMPAGPMQAFAGLTDEDALDIGYYLTTIPAIANGMIPRCTPPSDGGPEGGPTDALLDAPKVDAPAD